MTEPLPMSTEQADLLLGAVVGMTQGLRLVPLGDLADHLNKRRREALRRGSADEASVAETEACVAEAAYALVSVTEHLMDARRTPPATEDNPPLTGLPPSRQPLAMDDAWVAPPSRAAGG